MSERPDGFIVPPPGLIPGGGPADAPATRESPAAPDEQSGRSATRRVRPDERGAEEAHEQRLPASAPRPRPGGVSMAAASAALAARWRLHLPDGGEAAISGPTVVGRNPRRVEAAPNAETVALHDPGSSVSKTHALLEPDGAVLRVRDLHSTNGVAIIDRAGAPRVLEPGGSGEVADGEALELGRLRLAVERR